MNFKVAIVGRPNVGKSSIFNRILKKRLSIVHDKPGVTRDRIYAQADWLTKSFDIIDTGGIEIKNTPFLKKIKYQVQLAIDEANLILFVVDGRIFAHQGDMYIAKILLKIKKPVILVINKIDNKDLLSNTYDFYSLGFKNIQIVSANHGIGIGDLLDKIIFFHNKKEEELPKDSIIKFCFLGRPNVGKSTLTNMILSQERMVVSDISGTTTDAVDTFFQKGEKIYQVIDTAGIKKRGKIYEQEDKYSVLRALSALGRSDIACLVLDADKDISEQDKNIAGLILEYNKACIIIVNKWDLIKTEDPNQIKYFINKIRNEFQFLSYVPIIFLSAKNENKTKKEKLLNLLNQIFLNYTQKFSNYVLNNILQESILIHSISSFNKGKAKFNYITQTKNKFPEFVCFVNNPKFIHFSYERFLKNQFRKNLNLEGIPLKIIFKPKEIKDL
ncbi:ribosome biogenesis GTPase Der [Candidatus Phytoplasma pyri]|uniref:ribosome biogenesis GTPase Der n=1 Tax=Candidatus Phytoplasma pyri TaxID=47566 RepID=UPI003983A515